MNFFSKIDDAYVLLRQNGVYRQADLYRRGSNLFAKTGSGYIRLGISGSTSAPKVIWMELDPGQDAAHIFNKDGHMPGWFGNPAEASKKPTKLKAA